MSASRRTFLFWFSPYSPGLSSIYFDVSSFFSQVLAMGTPPGSILVMVVSAKMASSLIALLLASLWLSHWVVWTSLLNTSSRSHGCLLGTPSWGPLDLHTSHVHLLLCPFFHQSRFLLVVVKNTGWKLDLGLGPGSASCFVYSFRQIPKLIDPWLPHPEQEDFDSNSLRISLRWLRCRRKVPSAVTIFSRFGLAAPTFSVT